MQLSIQVASQGVEVGSRGGVWKPLVYGIHRCCQPRVQWRLPRRIYQLLQLLLAGGSHDGAGHQRPPQHEAQRQAGARQAPVCCQLAVRCHRVADVGFGAVPRLSLGVPSTIPVQPACR